MLPEFEQLISPIRRADHNLSPHIPPTASRNVTQSGKRPTRLPVHSYLNRRREAKTTMNMAAMRIQKISVPLRASMAETSM